MVKRCLISGLLAIAGVLSVCAQPAKDGFKQYIDCSVPKPEGSTRISEKDLVLTDKYLALYPEGIPIATAADLKVLYNFYRNHPEGKKEWASLCSVAVKTVSPWDLSKGPGMDRYIYKLGALRQLSLVYIFTGNALVGEFIKAHFLNIADLPVEFWIHAELRAYDPACPKGALETAVLNTALGYALTAIRHTLSEEQFRHIESAWRERGHQTALNWVRTTRLKSNWTAVIGSGLYYSAKWFGDEEAKTLAKEAIRYYIDACVEEDGSCCEGYDYFAYPLSTMARAALAMDKDEATALFADSPLSNSTRWRIYGMIFDLDGSGDPGVMRLNYGDNPYGNRDLKGPDLAGCFLKYVCADDVGSWLRSKYGCRMSTEELLFLQKFGANQPLRSPELAGLPLVKCFDNGDCFIRDGWGDEGKVLSMKCGDGGSRVNWSHNRPEFNSITLAAYGEYIIVQCGSASYRSPLHFEYDICTRSANTVTIDGKNQLFPRGPYVSEGKWDNSAVWVTGEPNTSVTFDETQPYGGGMIRSDAAQAYHIPMKEASRTVRYVPDGGFYILRDNVVPSDGEEHSYDWRLHLFNRDGKTYVIGKGNKLRVERGKADLYIVLDSPQKLSLKKRDAYLHHPVGRDYDAGGPKQGKPGSAIELDWSSKGESLQVNAVLYPVKAGEKAPNIVFKGDKVIVDGIVYAL